MGARIPGEGGTSARMLRRAERFRQAQEEQERKRLEQITEKVWERERTEALKQAEERRIFDLWLTADWIVQALEEQRDANAPGGPEDEWNELFREAVRMLPDARMYAQEMYAKIIGGA